jgi:hypothetical protein
MGSCKSTPTEQGAAEEEDRKEVDVATIAKNARSCLSKKNDKTSV